MIQSLVLQRRLLGRPEQPLAAAAVQRFAAEQDEFAPELARFQRRIIALQPQVHHGARPLAFYADERETIVDIVAHRVIPVQKRLLATGQPPLGAIGLAEIELAELGPQKIEPLLLCRRIRLCRFVRLA